MRCASKRCRARLLVVWCESAKRGAHHARSSTGRDRTAASRADLVWVKHPDADRYVGGDLFWAAGPRSRACGTDVCVVGSGLCANRDGGPATASSRRASIRMGKSRVVRRFVRCSVTLGGRRFRGRVLQLLWRLFAGCFDRQVLWRWRDACLWDWYVYGRSRRACGNCFHH